MGKLLGILPYLYFYDRPIHLGSISLLSVPDTQGRDFTPEEEIDRIYLQELIKCFPVSRGLQSDKGVIRAFTYFLADNPGKDNEQIHVEARKAITLLRYMMLRPDNQGLDDFETSIIYTFELPPVGEDDSRTYHCWVNFTQEEWPRPTYQKFDPPGWYVDFHMIPISNLEGCNSINTRFYGNLESELEHDILLAMEWYNYSFLKYSPRGLKGQLADISIAFETLFKLQKYKTTLYECINNTLGVEKDTSLERWSRDFYGMVRSATMHFGEPATFIYKHPDASEGHLSFLWSAQRIFRECVAVKAGLERQIENYHLIEELTPNEVTLKELRALGSYENIKSKGLGIWKLRQRYPVGDKEDIIWLGNTLLHEMRNQIPKSSLPTLVSIIDSIIQSSPDDDNLWSKYVQLDTELSNILFRGDIEKAKQLSQCMQLAHVVSKFANFAWYALQMLTFGKKHK